MTTQPDRRFDLSGGIQSATTWQLRKPNEVEDSINGVFNEYLGAIIRRLGYTAEGAALQSGKSGLGAHESKFVAGAKIIAAINNSGDTATNIKIYDASAQTWANLTLPGTVDPNTRMQFIDSVKETYVAGRSTSTSSRMTLLNIKDASTVSSTRNLIGAPKSKFIAEYGGCLYALNAEVSSTVFADRAYRSSPPLGAVTYIQGDQAAFDSIKVDSVRYLKAAMAIDIYTAGTETKTTDITITSVDKAANTLAYSGISTSTFTTGNVDIATEIITVGVNVATGTPIKITSTTTVPAGLTSGTVYYAINASATTIKVASSRSNATAGTAIDITSIGSGTHTLTRGVFFPDNDEIWLDGRKGELSYLWNTDYPTPQTADFLAIPPGVDADSEITGWAKSNNRLFFFTANSMHKWDNSNFPTVFEDIGCISHDSIQILGDWLLWLDAEGRVHARNDATGQHEIISKAIENTLLANVPDANWATATSGKIGNVYKLCLGTVDGSILRICYDFESNTWSHETHVLSMTANVRSSISGKVRLYFIGSDGRMYQDELGNTDNGVTIPFSVKFGRTNQMTEQLKNYHGVSIYGVNIGGTTVKADADGRGEFKEFGQLTQGVTKVAISGIKGQFSARDINVLVSINSDGDRPRIEGISYYSSQEEDKFGQPT